MTDDYKQKYEELMKRCEEFNIWFEDHKRKMNTNLSPGPAQTMDIQWPRDKMAWPWPTTAPWPPTNNICRVCSQDLSKLTHYVCYHPNCHQTFVGPTT